jgi:signal transduction histidine kinase
LLGVTLSSATSVVRDVARALRGAPELDLALAFAAFVALIITPDLSGEGNTVDAAAVALAGLTSFPLIVRRRYPLAVLVAVMAGLLGCLAVFHPDDAAVGVALLAVYTVGLQGRRVRSLLVGAAMAPTVAAAVIITSGEAIDLGETVARLAVILAGLAVGDARRGRRALVERAAAETKREREAETAHRFDEERLRLAHELHDTVAHALVGINARAAAAVHVRSTDSPDELDAFREIARSSADALAELRATLKLLRPAAGAAPMRPRQNLSDLPELVDGVRRAGLEIDLELELGEAEISPATAHGAYRIVQESLTNVLRHSRAGSARVRVGHDAGMVHIEVLDEGPPAVGRSDVAGQGRLGMGERANALGGRCESGPVEGGWHVVAELPTRVDDT